MPAVDPHFLVPGNCPQCTPARNGLGRSLWAPSSDTAGSFTGYFPGGNTGVPRAPPWPWPPAAWAGTPQESASGPGEPPTLLVCAWAVSPLATSSAVTPARLITARVNSRPLRCVRHAWDITNLLIGGTCCCAVY